MPRIVAFFASVASLAVATILLAGCEGSIHTAPLPSSTTRLTPNPDKIYVAPFDTSTSRWLVARDGIDIVQFKENFQTNFTVQLVTRLNKLAPSQMRWIDDLPDHGWLVSGQFIAVDQGKPRPPWFGWRWCR